MAFLDILAILFWPLVALFALLCWKFRSRGTFHDEWSLAFYVLIVFPLSVVWTSLGFSSLIAVFNFHLGLIIFGLIFIFYSPTSIRQKPGPERNRARLFLVLFGSPFLVWGGYYLIGDHLLPREIAEGRIQALDAKRDSVLPEDQTVTINDHEYKLTKRLRATLKVGDYVRIEAGQGSGYIYRLEHVPTR